MSVHQSYALTAPVDANRFLRTWTALSRGVFSATALLSDIAAILSTSVLTGIGYHFVA